MAKTIEQTRRPFFVSSLLLNLQHNRMMELVAYRERNDTAPAMKAQADALIAQVLADMEARAMRMAERKVVQA